MFLKGQDEYARARRRDNEDGPKGGEGKAITKEKAGSEVKGKTREESLRNPISREGAREGTMFQSMLIRTRVGKNLRGNRNEKPMTKIVFPGQGAATF